MVEEPEIVKLLRQSEKLETLFSKPSISGAQNYIEQSNNDPSENIIEEKSILKNNYEQTLCEDGNIYKKIVENLIEGILIIDFNGKILYANSAIAKIFKFKDVETNISKNVLNYIDSKYLTVFIKDQLLKDKGEVRFSNTYEIKTSNGTKIWIEGLETKIKFKGENANVVFIRDVTERRKTWEELVKLKEKYQVLVETSLDGIIIIDELGRLSYVNPSFEKMCKKKKENILSTLFRDIITKKSVYLYQQVYIDSRKNNKKIENIELELVTGNNFTVPIEINVAPINQNGKFFGLLCTIRDITERKKIEEDIKKSERLKTEFMNIAAHELKSPVTPIKGYLDLIISDKETNKRIKKWAEISQRNLQRLLRLVDEILDVSRLDSDTMRFDMEKISLNKILNEIVEDFRLDVEAKKLDFIIKISNNLPFIYGDKFRLSQVFKNLIGNAMKFTDNGSITVEAKKLDKNAMITIKDTGIGISKDETNKIFTKFYQSYTGHDRKNEGTGLGLFISKEIIDKHNGKIWAESENEKGSEFHVKLPIL